MTSWSRVSNKSSGLRRDEASPTAVLGVSDNTSLPTRFRDQDTAIARVIRANAQNPAETLIDLKDSKSFEDELGTGLVDDNHDSFVIKPRKVNLWFVFFNHAKSDR